MSLSLLTPGVDLQSRLSEALQKYGIRQIDVAKETGIHHSTLSQWLQRKAKGNTNRQEEAIESWLNNLYSNKPKLAGTNISRLQLLKGKRERTKLFDDFDNNNDFDNIIPININVELEGKKYKEQLFWNINESYLRVEAFAKILSDDNHLPQGFENEIAAQMNKQVAGYKRFDKVKGEIIKTIKLDIRIDDIVYTDQFEWDINNPDNKPEEFAKSLCIDLGLGTEFVVPIVHSIRTQILDYQKSISSDRKNYYYGFNKGNIGSGRAVIDSTNYIRDIYDEDSEWQPCIKRISQDEIKKFEKKEERKIRYAQRRK